jgi:hypothetical protein
VRNDGIGDARKCIFEKIRNRAFGIICLTHYVLERYLLPPMLHELITAALRHHTVAGSLPARKALSRFMASARDVVIDHRRLTRFSRPRGQSGGAFNFMQIFLAHFPNLACLELLFAYNTKANKGSRQ